MSYNCLYLPLFRSIIHHKGFARFSFQDVSSSPFSDHTHILQQSFENKHIVYLEHVKNVFNNKHKQE